MRTLQRNARGTTRRSGSAGWKLAIGVAVAVLTVAAIVHLYLREQRVREQRRREEAQWVLEPDNPDERRWRAEVLDGLRKDLGE